MPSRHIPLPRRSWISSRLFRLIAFGQLATLAFVFMTSSAQAATETPDPSPSALRPDPFPVLASRPTAVAPSGVGAVVPVSTQSPIQAQTRPLAQPAVARPTSGSAGPSRPRQRPHVAGGSRPSASSHSPRRTIERPNASLASAVNEAKGSGGPAALGPVSPRVLRIAATLLAVLAVAGFSLAASVVRLESKG